MIEDVLIVFGAVGEAAGPYGVALAKQLGAATRCLGLQPDGDRGLAEVRYDLVVSARDEALRTVREAAENLAYAVRAAEVPTETETIHGAPDVVRAQLLARARMHDLVVFEQPSLRRERPADAYVDDILLGTGRRAEAVRGDRELSMRPSPG
ncbi:hypothetical protein [Methylobacterium radiotolerans]|uniref:hypothetical protein n=1 Tax=Methylobacterium radiotolerans TaxID=31998 RepID=UPI001FDA4C6B|nr:hypothetical protein [Methylobacterium radiotolerans]